MTSAAILLASLAAASAGEVRRGDALELADWDADGRTDLVVVYQTATPSTFVEVAIYSNASGLQSEVLHVTTPIAVKDDSWVFRVGDWTGDGIVDLVGIAKNRTASGQVEVNILSGESDFQQFVLQAVVPWNPLGTHWDVDVADWNGDGVVDLAGVIRKPPAGANVEINILSGASNFQTHVLQQVVEPIGAVGTNWSFRLIDFDNDGVPDLAGIKKNGTGSCKVEVNVLSGASGLESFLLQTVTEFTAKNHTWTPRAGHWDLNGAVDIVGVTFLGSSSGLVEVEVASGESGFSNVVPLQSASSLFAPSSQNVSVCPTEVADAAGVVSASASLQACIDLMPLDGVLEIPAGTYLLTTPLVIQHRLTLRTAGTTTSNQPCETVGAPPCARLLASADFPPALPSTT